MPQTTHHFEKTDRLMIESVEPASYADVVPRTAKKEKFMKLIASPLRNSANKLARRGRDIESLKIVTDQ